MARVVRLIGLSLVVVLVTLGANTQVAYGDPGTIDITAPPAVTSWELAIGDYPDNERTGLLMVTSDTGWTVTATDADTANTTGQMTSYNGTAYDTGTKLDNPMKVGCAAQSTEATMPNGGTVASGSGDANLTIFFRQKIEYRDPVLSAGNYYRIVVTFTGSTL